MIHRSDPAQAPSAVSLPLNPVQPSSPSPSGAPEPKRSPLEPGSRSWARSWADPRAGVSSSDSWGEPVARLAPSEIDLTRLSPTPSADGSSPEPSRQSPHEGELHFRLLELLARSRSLQRASLGFGAPGTLLCGLIPRTREVVREADAWLTEAAEQMASSRTPFEGYGADSFVDLCSLAASDLRAHRDALDGLPESAETPSISWSSLVRLEAAIEALGEALAAVEPELAALLGVPTEARDPGDLEQSLKVRARYGRFRWSVRKIQKQAAGIPVGVRLEFLLDGLGTALEELHRSAEFSSMRVTDRWMVRQLEQRVQLWLRRRPLDEVAGRRHLDEVLLFISLIDHVNQGQELIHHDRSLLPGLIEELEAAVAERPAETATEPVPPELAEGLEVLVGRDEVLDDLLRSWAPAPVILHALYTLEDPAPAQASRAAAPAW